MKSYSKIYGIEFRPHLFKRLFISILVLWASLLSNFSWSEAPTAQGSGAVGQCKTNWLYQGAVGLSTHYFPTTPENREKIANAFQVRKVAEQAAEAGAAWFLFTLHHQPWIMMAPNATYERILGNGNYTTRRDVPLELYRELQPKGIKLMLYVNLKLDPRSAVSEEVRLAMGGWPPNEKLFENIAAVYRDYSVRYGDKVSGWWVDATWMKEYRDSPHRERWFRMVADALRAGNPSALVTFNPGVKVDRYTGNADYTAGESDDLMTLPSGRWIDGAQWHLWTYLGGWWSSGGTRFSDKQLGDFVSQVTAKGGSLTFEVGTRGVNYAGKPKHNRSGDRVVTPHVGYIDPAQIDQIKAIRNYRHPAKAGQLANCIN